jgi:hypothetical protein
MIGRTARRWDRPIFSRPFLRDLRGRAAGQLYPSRSGQLAALLHRRCATLVDIAGKVDEMDSGLGLLT